MEKIIIRINEMETILDDGDKTLETLEINLTALESQLNALTKLFDYYFSEDWYADLNRDNNNELPQDLKRGVLSQDAIYNLFSAYLSIAERMQELSTKMLEYKKRD